MLAWAISWPLIRYGVASVPPIWYACFRYAIAAPCLFLLVGLRRELAFPPRADWPLILVSGGMQMGVYSALTSLALTRLPAGRASVLAFSTPIWVIPLAHRWLEEKVTRNGWFGLALGVAGAWLIAAPSLRGGTQGQVLACAALLVAAMACALSIVRVRLHRFTASPLALAPWQCLVAIALLLPCALLLEDYPPRIGAAAAWSLAYVGPIATAFAYWAVVEAGTRLRASEVSMALLATPPVGILISVLTAHESVDASLVAGASLTGAGIFLATRSARARTAEQRNESPVPCD